MLTSEPPALAKKVRLESFLDPSMISSPVLSSAILYSNRQQRAVPEMGKLLVREQIVKVGRG